MGMFSKIFCKRKPPEKIFGKQKPPETVLFDHPDPELMGLIRELVEIGLGAGFMVKKPDGIWEKNKRAREIGEILNEKGGFILMVKVHSAVMKTMGYRDKSASSRLESCWNNIGRWRA